MTLKAGVIGVGSMGRNHARVYKDLPEIHLAGVSDIDAPAAESVGAHFGTPAFGDYRRMLDEAKPDLVSVAVPTSDHLVVAREVIGRGIDLLIEKPIAATVEEGQHIIAEAEEAGVQLMIGHIERFNPAVVVLKEHLANEELGRVFQIDARRQGPFPARIRDVGVVIDLAVHDLDVIRYVTGAEVERIYAETERRIHTTHEDLLTGLIRLDDGTIATLTVNWLTPTKIRELQVTGERGMFRVDYLTQDLYFFENGITPMGDWPLQNLRGVTEGRMIRYLIHKREPLRIELEAFVAAVRGDAPIPVTGQDGLQALALAQAVSLSGSERRLVHVEEIEGCARAYATD